MARRWDDLTGTERKPYIQRAQALLSSPLAARLLELVEKQSTRENKENPVLISMVILDIAEGLALAEWVAADMA